MAKAKKVQEEVQAPAEDVKVKAPKTTDSGETVYKETPIDELEAEAVETVGQPTPDFVQGDKVSYNGKVGTVAAISVVNVGTVVVSKYTVSFPDGNVAQYVQKSDLAVAA